MMEGLEDYEPGASGSSFVKKSAARMLSGKRPNQAVSAAKKGGSSKPVASIKVEGGGQQRTVKAVEPEDVEPSEMSVEEIESRLGSLIQAETISQLKSTVWKERLEGVYSE